MIIKSFQQNDPSADKKINLYIIILNLGLLYVCFRDFHFISSTINGCGLFIQKSGVESIRFLQTLMGISLLALIFYKHKFRTLIFVVQTLLFYIVFKDFVICQAGPEKVQESSSHAIIFWLLLSLVLVDLIKKEKVLFLLKFVLIMSYFNSVFAKLLFNVNWANGYTLQYYFLERHLMLDLPLAMPIMTNHSLAVICSWIVLVAEITSPLSFLNRKLEVFYLVFFLLFQISCIFMIELKFMSYYGIAYLVYLADYGVEYGKEAYLKRL